MVQTDIRQHIIEVDESSGDPPPELRLLFANDNEASTSAGVATSYPSAAGSSRPQGGQQSPDHDETSRRNRLDEVLQECDWDETLRILQQAPTLIDHSYIISAMEKGAGISVIEKMIDFVNSGESPEKVLYSLFVEAIMQDNWEVTDLILKKERAPNTPVVPGLMSTDFYEMKLELSLEKALRFCRWDVIVRILLKFPRSILHREFQFDTLLVAAIMSSADITSIEKMVDMALEQHPDPLRCMEEPLYQALLRDKLEVIKVILDKTPDMIRTPIGEDRDIPLFVSIRESGVTAVIDELIRRCGDDERAISNEKTTALHWAALLGFSYAVEKVSSAFPRLLLKKDCRKKFPLELAASQGHWGVCYYLLSKTEKFEHLTDYSVLRPAILSGVYDLAVSLLEQYSSVNSNVAAKILELLVERPQMFRSGTKLSKLESVLYSRIRFRPSVYRAYSKVKPHSKIEYSRVKVINRIFWFKQEYYQAVELVMQLCKKIRARDTERVTATLGPCFLSAIRNGTIEVVQVMLKEFPYLMKYREVSDNGVVSALHVAAFHRHEEMFNYLHRKLKAEEPRDMENRGLKYYEEYYGKHFLHLVARRPQINRLDHSSGVGLQIQREFYWFKEVEKSLPPQLRTEKNEQGKTPLQVFVEEHQAMVSEEREWIRSMVNACIVAAALVVTVVFAASITVPGGNGDKGLSDFSERAAFSAFGLSNSLALVSSLTALVTYLCIFSTHFTMHEFLHDLPLRLTIGLVSLLLSLVFMAVAFCAAVRLTFQKHNHWIFYPTSALSGIAVSLFVYFQLPLIKSIGGSSYGRLKLQEYKSSKYIRDGVSELSQYKIATRMSKDTL